VNQKEQLKRHFDRGLSITSREALLDLNIYALSQRCGDIEAGGYPLERVWIKLKSGKSCIRYSKADRTLQSMVMRAA
jgi:hypothetical protein